MIFRLLNVNNLYDFFYPRGQEIQAGENPLYRAIICYLRFNFWNLLGPDYYRDYNLRFGTS